LVSEFTRPLALAALTDGSAPAMAYAGDPSLLPGMHLQVGA